MYLLFSFLRSHSVMTTVLMGIMCIKCMTTCLLLMNRLFPASLCSALLVFSPPSPLMNLQRCLYSWQVDIKNQGKTALQVAAHQGHMEVVKALLQANSSIEVKDEDGDAALHYTAFG